MPSGRKTVVFQVKDDRLVIDKIPETQVWYKDIQSA